MENRDQLEKGDKVRENLLLSINIKFIAYEDWAEAKIRAEYKRKKRRRCALYSFLVGHKFVFHML